MNFEKKELYTAKRASGINVDDPVIQLTWEKLRSNNESTNWMLLYLSAPTVVSVKSFGSGGVEELISQLTENDIFFGSIRVTVNSQTRFYHIYYVGGDVNGMKAGKASMFESGIFQSLEGSHGKIQFKGLDEITPASVKSQLQIVSKSSDVNL